MEMVVVRETKTALSTIGTLSIDGKPFGSTLELPWKNNQHLVSCIPTGTYEVQLLPSPKFNNAPTPHVLNVPGRDNILMHVGNFPRDTEGCLLVGSFPGRDLVGDSKKAFAQLVQKMQQLPAGEKISLTIKEKV
jgi:hypothetical protein